MYCGKDKLSFNKFTAILSIGNSSHSRLIYRFVY